MFSKKKTMNRLVRNKANTTRRKRMLANNKKQVLWRHRSYVFWSEVV
ncbi:MULTISPECIES: hypothetical protein [Vibrio]|uniref:50S ribosomal protein L20 n=1 Tax=Vibrio algivorus TaxID=1667024 RepID=A0ABQ6ES18_9VIBR|nr:MULTISPECIES: hypothetical protein [Vibrio]MCF7354246.1 hypothetical protein [Vibrio sp. CK2-1]GLT15536.1 hypothetical protein GCM10007931_25110 [Vibrio algivorus]